MPSTIRASALVFSSVVLSLIVTSRVGHAQSRADCSTPVPPSAGMSAGRASPYFDLSPELVERTGGTSTSVRSGTQLTGRVEMPIGGPWRARVEGTTARWRVERQTYGDGFQVVGRDSIGHVSARQVVAMIGRRGGRSPACGYVLAGAGLYSLDYRDATLYRPGGALTAGIELPIGGHGAVQVEAQLHVIDTGGRPPSRSTTALAASLSVGWVWGF